MKSIDEKVQDPKDELMLVEVTDLTHLELHCTDMDGNQYAPIIMILNNNTFTYFGVGMYFGSNRFNSEFTKQEEKYYTFISELEHNEKKLEKIQNLNNLFFTCSYNMVTSIQTQ